MKTFRTFTEDTQRSQFEVQLHALKPHIVKAAQKEYDDWNQDEHGHDEELGSGGICDRISGHIQNLVSQHIPHAHVMEGGQDGDDHSYAVAHNGHHAYSIDIPHHIYEHGGGYSWKKRPGVRFHPDHVSIDKLPVHPRDLEEDEIGEDEGGAPTNNAGGGNVAGIGIGTQGEPGVSPEYQRKRNQLKLMNGPAVDPRMFADKIFNRKKPVS